MGNRWPMVSIIIPTHTADEATRNCVAACARLDYPGYEIIVVPDEAVTEINAGGRTRWVPAAVLPGEKKNRGVMAARGEVCAFIDSDAYPSSDWLKNGVRHLFCEGVGAVGGPNLTPPEDSVEQQLSGVILSSVMALGKFAKRYRKTAWHYVLEIPSCNLLVRKETFLRAGGFVRNLLTAEDASLSFQIANLGLKLVFSPDVVVYHHRRPIFKRYFQQIFRYGRDKRALLKTLSLPELFGKLCYFSLPLGVPCGLLLLILALVLKPLRPVVFSGAAVYLMAVWAEAIF
ncbi:MAG TPA: glycosyltransferase, partial [bacterium]|nr:glycosyltransferase [bacterium]